MIHGVDQLEASPILGLEPRQVVFLAGDGPQVV